jgi:hypothetical protein
MEKKKVSMVKTSISHPLRIDEVKAPNNAGIIGMTLCPGKKIVSAISGVWDRDLDIDLRNLENGNGGSATGALQEKKDSRQYRVRELKDFDAVLSEVIAAGFGPPALFPHLRQYAINNAMLCLKAQWLKKLSALIRDEPLPKWKRQADETGLHADFSSWIDNVMTHLVCYCATVGPNPPAQNSFSDGPTAVELAGIICTGAREMFLAVRELACGVWWKSFDTAVLKPVSQQIADAKKEQKALKERLLDSKLDTTECSAGEPLPAGYQ